MKIHIRLRTKPTCVRTWESIHPPRQATLTTYHQEKNRAKSGWISAGIQTERSGIARSRRRAEDPAERSKGEGVGGAVLGG
uniref:Uncharacterized protein n=1 Tax=Arundo donax TaxID=35708 RepID=A0A0A9DSH0_ARUDO